MTARESLGQLLHNPAHSALQAFSALKVRPKLVVLHNLFFLVLTVSVYLAVIPIFSEDIANARSRELHMVSQIFSADLPLEPLGLGMYNYREGGPRELGLSQGGQRFLTERLNSTWEQAGGMLFRHGRSPGQYRRVGLSPGYYEKSLRQARIGLFVVLGGVYLLSILILEFAIMPHYVYRPLRLMLNADDAIQRDDRRHELIDEHYIPADEIGQIMRSRNNTIAQLRQQEDHLAMALQKLEEQDRLVSLGLLSTSVAHELNTPLAVLQGSIEKLLETERDSSTLDRLARMLRVTQRLRRISESLVEFARLRKQHMEPVLLHPLIEESWGLLAIDEKAAEAQFENNVGMGDMVIGNPDRLIQVFVNLLRNALLAIPPGGAVRVQSKLLQKAGQNWISCVVQDNGPGIPAHVLPNLFEAFVSTRLDARGTGLGLTVAEGIVTQHGGTITASNRPEGGASLEVVLPAAA